VGGVGLAKLAGEEEDFCEMQKLYFKPNVKGTGLGRRMIALILSEARLREYRFRYIETLPEIGPAVKLYEEFEFKYLDGPLGNTGHATATFAC
jgi:putative acetyltransferase